MASGCCYFEDTFGQWLFTNLLHVSANIRLGRCLATGDKERAGQMQKRRVLIQREGIGLDSALDFLDEIRERKLLYHVSFLCFWLTQRVDSNAHQGEVGGLIAFFPVLALGPCVVFL